MHSAGAALDIMSSSWRASIRVQARSSCCRAPRCCPSPPPGLRQFLVRCIHVSLAAVCLWSAPSSASPRWESRPSSVPMKTLMSVPTKFTSFSGRASRGMKCAGWAGSTRCTGSCWRFSRGMLLIHVELVVGANLPYVHLSVSKLVLPVAMHLGTMIGTLRSQTVHGSALLEQRSFGQRAFRNVCTRPTRRPDNNDLILFHESNVKTKVHPKQQSLPPSSSCEHASHHNLRAQPCCELFSSTVRAAWFSHSMPDAAREACGSTWRPGSAGFYELRSQTRQVDVAADATHRERTPLGRVVEHRHTPYRWRDRAQDIETLGSSRVLHWMLLDEAVRCGRFLQETDWTVWCDSDGASIVAERALQKFGAKERSLGDWAVSEDPWRVTEASTRSRCLHSPAALALIQVGACRCWCGKEGGSVGWVFGRVGVAESLIVTVRHQSAVRTVCSDARRETLLSRQPRGERFDVVHIACAVIHDVMFLMVHQGMWYSFNHPAISQNGRHDDAPWLHGGVKWVCGGGGGTRRRQKGRRVGNEGEGREGWMGKGGRGDRRWVGEGQGREYERKGDKEEVEKWRRWVGGERREEKRREKGRDREREKEEKGGREWRERKREEGAFGQFHHGHLVDSGTMRRFHTRIRRTMLVLELRHLSHLSCFDGSTEAWRYTGQ